MPHSRRWLPAHAQVNELRRELKALKVEKQKAALAGAGSRLSVGLQPSGLLSPSQSVDVVSVGKEVEMQKEMIARLREELATSQARVTQLEPRPMSRERLPPLDAPAGGHA